MSHIIVVLVNGPVISAIGGEWGGPTSYSVPLLNGSEHWLFKIGRAGSGKCLCDQRVIQNATHALKCQLVGDGKGKTLEQAEGDEEFCGHLYSFLSNQLQHYI